MELLGVLGNSHHNEHVIPQVLPSAIFLVSFVKFPLFSSLCVGFQYFVRCLLPRPVKAVWLRSYLFSHQATKAHHKADRSKPSLAIYYANSHKPQEKIIRPLSKAHTAHNHPRKQQLTCPHPSHGYTQHTHLQLNNYSHNGTSQASSCG